MSPSSRRRSVLLLELVPSALSSEVGRTVPTPTIRIDRVLHASRRAASAVAFLLSADNTLRASPNRHAVGELRPKPVDLIERRAWKNKGQENWPTG
jgi:hypothetical protein